MNLTIKRKKLLVIVIILLIIAISIAAFYTSIKEPDVDVTSIRFKSINPEQASITFLVTLDVYNPNIITAKLDSIDVKVYIDGQFIRVVDQEVNQDIKASEHTKLTLDFVLYNVPIIDSREITVKVRGEVKISVWVFDFNVPIDETKQVVIGEDEVNNQPPVAVINYDAIPPPRVGQDIAFNGSMSSDPDGEIFLYEWDFGDGSPKVNGEFVKHKYNNAGEYDVTLVVFDMLNDSGSDTDVIIVFRI